MDIMDRAEELSNEELKEIIIAQLKKLKKEEDDIEKILIQLELNYLYIELQERYIELRCARGCPEEEELRNINNKIEWFKNVTMGCLEGIREQYLHDSYEMDKEIDILSDILDEIEDIDDLGLLDMKRKEEKLLTNFIVSCIYKWH